jgi:DNA-binding transcriptional ArsR family regulator
MSRRPTLYEIRREVLLELDDEWRTPSEMTDRLRLGHGIEWLAVALTMERLANDGLVELKMPGSRTRRFRRRAA